MAVGTAARKSDHWFKLVDVNGDGTIQRNDLQALGERMLKHFRHDKTSPEGRRLTEAYERCWTIMAEAMDTDKNQAVSQEEFRSYMAGNAKKENADDLLRPITDAEFAVADLDNDGHLSPSEYAELLRAMGLSDVDAQQGAASIDTNRDGRISSEEYFRACRDFFAGSDDLNKRTSQVFGGV
ncbi:MULTISPECIES: EF-hand domain-containing protein [Streptosporangium]|uniref:Ca2+-binding EF-hand superfamily protein n=1 Tax=Streptosporangium brasiliense TaxID=47480 RepID=A0ABT9RGR7_9ACTN|nr:EF-hand domain-containing protein [Streptosporangium brasiliense]MDP9867535.1 Ca2+-binding EF-hand superfamily protein [Streptosporangium brasiliense]